MYKFEFLFFLILKNSDSRGGCEVTIQKESFPQLLFIFKILRIVTVLSVNWSKYYDCFKHTNYWIFYWLVFEIYITRILCAMLKCFSMHLLLTNLKILAKLAKDLTFIRQYHFVAKQTYILRISFNSSQTHLLTLHYFNSILTILLYSKELKVLSHSWRRLECYMLFSLLQRVTVVHNGWVIYGLNSR